MNHFPCKLEFTRRRKFCRWTNIAEMQRVDYAEFFTGNKFTVFFELKQKGKKRRRKKCSAKNKLWMIEKCERNDKKAEKEIEILKGTLMTCVYVAVGQFFSFRLASLECFCHFSFLSFSRFPAEIEITWARWWLHRLDTSDHRNIATSQLHATWIINRFRILDLWAVKCV